MSDFDKSLELLKAELEKSQTGMTADEIKDLLAKGTSDEEKAKTVLELLEKAKKKEEPDDEDDEKPGDESDDEEPDDDEDDMEKSLFDGVDSEYEDYISAEPVLKSMMKSIANLNKKLEKQERLIKSMGSALIGVAELTKSTHEAVDVVASLPAPLKGQILSLTKSQKEELSKGAVDRFPAHEQSYSKDDLLKSIDKAYDAGSINLAQFSFLNSQVSANRPVPQEFHSLIKSYIEGGK